MNSNSFSTFDMGTESC